MHMTFVRNTTVLFASILALGGLTSAAFAQTVYTGGAGGALVDATATAAGVANFDLVLASTGATVTAFNSVTISNFTHTWVGDLEVRLTKVGTGQNVVLMSPPDGVSSNLNGTYTFVVDAARQTIDEAATPLTTAQNVAAGLYAISGYGGGTAAGPRTNYSTFTGVPIDGTWRLTISDFGSGDTGAITGWQFSSFVSAPAVVPEAGTLPLMGTALLGIVGIIKRRRK